MTYLTDRYVDFFSDYGFNRIFGAEPNKDLLLDFLNEILKGKHEIADLHYLHREDFPGFSLGGQAFITARCRNASGQELFVQLQKAEERFWKGRDSCFFSFPILKHIRAEILGQSYVAVYLIGLFDFVFRDGRAEPGRYRYDIAKKAGESENTPGDKVNFISLELPKLIKTYDDLESRLEKWLYVLKNLGHLDEFPDCQIDEVLKKVLYTASLANLSCDEIRKYEESLKHLRDMRNCVDTAREEGRREGLMQYRLDLARTLLGGASLDDSEIAKITNLHPTDINGLRKEAANAV